MKMLTKTLITVAILGATATSAQAWWGPWGGWGSPWSGSDTWGWGDVDFNFRTTGWGRSAYYPWYGYGYPYGGYPYWGGYPYSGVPYAMPYYAPRAAAPAGESK
jgi:hypothetical protein